MNAPDNKRNAPGGECNMTREEIIEAIFDDKMMPFIQTDHLANIVDFVIKNYHPSLPSNLDEAADTYTDSQEGDYPFSEGMDNFCYGDIHRAFKAGAEWIAKQGVTKEAVIGIATEEISINVSQQTFNELDLCPGDKVVVQIRKK